MNISILQTKLLIAALLAVGFTTPLLVAECLKMHTPDHSGGWTVNVSTEYNSHTLESTDQYLSGPAGTEDWEAEHDLDGDLYGFSISTTPPVHGKRMTVYFSYRTGELDGGFNTREISPTPEGPYFGKVEYDRDEWELGTDILILNAVYVRLEYFTYEMEGDWVYFDGSPNEPQEYEYDAFTLGAGFRQDYPIDYLAEVLFQKPRPDQKSDFAFVVDAFLGISYFEFEHTEKLTGASVDTEDIGYEGSVEVLGMYTMRRLGDLSFFGGGGYGHKNSDDDDLDLTNEGFFAKIGVQKDF